MPALTTIGFDADDTLWHNERFFQLTEARFREMLADHADADLVSSRLLEAERRNLGHYGFGIKGFVLSMIETALDVTGDTAVAKIILDYPAVRFTDYMALSRIDGRWVIVNKMFQAEPKAPPA